MIEHVASFGCFLAISHPLGYDVSLGRSRRAALRAAGQ